MKYDLCIIGCGPAGYAAALRAAALKMQVIVLTGGKSKFGGTCLNQGCIPLKILNAAARDIRRQKQMEKFGLYSIVSPLDWAQLCRYTKDTCKNLRTSMLTQLTVGGISVLEEKGKLLDEHRIATESTLIESTNILLATGASEKNLSGSISLPEVMNLSELPPKLAIVGAGVLGCELATIFHELGAETFLLEKNRRILSGWDGECAQWLHENMSNRGIRIMTGRDGCDFPTHHVMLNAVGRVPATAELGLKEVGINIDAQGHVPVNDRQQTSIANIYAAGDLCCDSSTAPMAEIQGLRAVAYMTERMPFPVSEHHPRAIFSVPELASAGLTSEQADTRRITVATAKYPLAALGHVLIDAGGEGFVKVIYKKNSRKLLGVHIAGGPAAEMIAAADFAVNSGAKLDDYCGSSWVHPSYSEALYKVAIRAMNRGRR